MSKKGTNINLRLNLTSKTLLRQCNGWKIINFYIYLFFAISLFCLFLFFSFFVLKYNQRESSKSHHKKLFHPKELSCQRQNFKLEVLKVQSIFVTGCFLYCGSKILRFSHENLKIFAVFSKSSIIAHSGQTLFILKVKTISPILWRYLSRKGWKFVINKSPWLEKLNVAVTF